MRYADRPYAALVPALLLMAALVTAPLVAQSQQEGNVSEAAPKAGAAAGDAQSFQTDLFTGRFTYAIPIEVPAGRHGLTPRLAVAYDSSGGNGATGVGWAYEVGAIVRDGKDGVPVQWQGGFATNSYDDTKGFVYSLLGASARLVKTIGQTHRPEIDRTGLTFLYHDNASNPGQEPYWEATDKAGTKYFFGETAASRVAHPGFPTGLGKSVAQWALSRIRDVNGNEIAFSYWSDQGHLYLSNVDYNNQVGAAAIPVQHRIHYLFEDRTDPVLSFRHGFRDTTAKRLKMVRILRADLSPIREYVMFYSQSPTTGRSLLRMVNRGGNQGGVLPPLEFAYTEAAPGFQPAVSFGPVESEATTSLVSWHSPAYRAVGSAQKTRVDLLDLDGDGLDDRVLIGTPTPSLDFTIQYNDLLSGLAGATGFRPKSVWPNVWAQGQSGEGWSAITYVDGNADTLVGLWDLDGDGLLDHVMRRAAGSTDYWDVQLNTGSGFANVQAWGPVLGDGTTSANWNSPFGASSAENTLSALIDLNGDGRLDHVMSYFGTTPNQFNVQLNTGTGFEGSTRAWTGISSQGVTDWGHLFKTASRDTLVGLYDLNGDGLPDRVTRDPASPFTTLRVQWNNGSGFEPFEDFGPVLVETGATDAGWFCPVGVATTTGAVYRHAALMDINGDGLPDRVLRKLAAPYDLFRVQINNGSSFGPLVDWTGLDQTNTGVAWNSLSASDDSADAGEFVTFADLNGDRLPDRVLRATGSPYASFRVQYSSGPYPDLLRTVENGYGAQVDVVYRPSSAYDNRDDDWTGDPWTSGRKSLLPFVVNTVASVTQSTTQGWTATTNYSYRHGYFDPERREFRGFNFVQVTAPNGTVTKTWFHQGGGYDDSANGEWFDAGSKSKQGIAYRTEVTGPGGEFYSRTLSKVEETQVHPAGVYFPYVAQTWTGDSGGLPTIRYTATRTVYDTATLNPLRSESLGEVSVLNPQSHQITDLGADAVYTHTTWAIIPANPAIVDRPAAVKITSDVNGLNVLRETRFTWSPDTRANLVKTERWLQQENRFTIETYAYDANGNRIETIDPSGGRTTTEYLAPGYIYPRFQRAHLGAGYFESETIHDQDSGQILSRTDSKGMVLRYAYDQFYRLTLTERATTPYAAGTTNAWVWTEKAVYNLVAAPAQSWIRKYVQDGHDPIDGHWTEQWLDGLGRTIAVGEEAESTAPASARWMELEYDTMGRCVRQTVRHFASAPTWPPSPTAAATTTVYDPVGRVLGITPPVGDQTSPTGPLTTVYAEFMNPWAMHVTDAGQKQKRYLMNARGKVQVVRELVLGSWQNTSYSHDLLGQLTSVVDAAGNVTMVGFDSLGRRTSVDDPDLGLWTYGYDDLGRLTSQTDAKGQRTVFTLDELGRVIQKRVFSATNLLLDTVTYEFDVVVDPAFTVYAGQIARITDSEGWEKRGYDLFGRLVRVERYVTRNAQSYLTRYEYDDADQVVMTWYPRSNVSVRSSYESGGVVSRVESVTGPAGTEVFYRALSFDEVGQVTALVYGNGCTTTHTYFPNSKRLQRIQTSTAQGATLQDLSYTWDAAANLLGIGDAAWSGVGSAALTSIHYDDLHRLTGYTRAGIPTVFSYDATGNFVFNGENPGTIYTYDPAHPHAVTSAAGKGYVYDANGSMTQRGTQTLAWDGNNRLARVTDGALTVDFGYTYSGDRLWKETLERSVWIGSLYEERGTKKLFHVMAGARRICTFQAGRFALAPVLVGQPAPTQPLQLDPVFYYYHQDHLNGTNLVTDRYGNLAQHYEYKAFGASRFVSNPSAFAVTNRYTDHALDEETGLYWMKTRYYDADLGRFIQPDTTIPVPEDPQSLNRYSYADNNPLKLTDPSGHGFFIALLVKALIGGILGGIAAEIQGGDFWDGFVQGAIAGAVGHIVGAASAATGIQVNGVVGQAALGAAQSIATGGDWWAGAAQGALFGSGQGDFVGKVAADLQELASSFATNAAFTASKAFFARHVAAFAAKNGWNPQVFNLALQGLSLAGNEIVGTRYDPNVGPAGRMYGILSRLDGGWIEAGTVWNKVAGLPFDIVDITLAYQGQATASSREFFTGPNRSVAGLTAHSLGTLDVANLAAAGLAPKATLYALPFGKIAPFGPSTFLGRNDPVTGYSLNVMLNWSATVIDTGTGFVSAHNLTSYLAALAP